MNLDEAHSVYDALFAKLSELQLARRALLGKPPYEPHIKFEPQRFDSLAEVAWGVQELKVGIERVQSEIAHLKAGDETHASNIQAAATWLQWRPEDLASQDPLTVERAFAALRCVDNQYVEIYADYCAMIGVGAQGIEGYPIFTSVAEIAKRIEARKSQIDHYKGLIETLRNLPDTREREASAKIMAIVDELGIKL